MEIVEKVEKEQRQMEGKARGTTTTLIYELHAKLTKCICLSIEENVDSKLCNIAREERRRDKE